MADDHVPVTGTPLTDDAGAGDSDLAARRGPAVQTLPLNSRRLTAALLRQLAGGLGVPTTAPQGDLLTMIESKLTEEDRDPLHTQLLLHDVAGGVCISLRDESGVFLEIQPPERDSPPASGLSEGESGSESDTVTALEAEITELKAELEKQRGKTRDLWRLNCEQLAEFDSSLAEKDEEIASLKDEVSRLHRSSLSDSSEAASTEVGGVFSSFRVRWGKAPPVDPFTGEDPECRLDD